MGVTLLNVDGLVTEFYGEGRTVRAIDHVSFHVDKGEILGVIGNPGAARV